MLKQEADHPNVEPGWEQEIADLPAPETWKVLVVDDEEDIHAVTRLALKAFTIEGRPLIFLHAYSAAEARQVMQEHPDLAVILLDVVMENNHAGLELVEFIRKELQNGFVRIVLRTGQPGEAPEEKVIRQFQIDDYRLKTELTRDKLYSVLMASLRTYEAMMKVETYRQQLEDKVAARTHEISAQNKQLLQQKAELEKLNGLNHKLLSILAHDLRSPLSTLHTLLGAADQDYLSPADFQELLSGIKHKLGYTTDLLEKLLAWAKTQQGGFRCQPEKLCLNSLLATLLPLHEASAKQKGVVFELNKHTDQQCWADPTMLTVVLNNLLQNALKFTPTGGRITVQIQAQADRIEMGVLDTGKGFSLEKWHLLETHQLPSDSGTQGERGTGLGLMLCRDFIQQNQGKFWYQPLEQGSAFWVSLPVGPN